MPSPIALPNREFWSGRRVLVTGHSGFKGAWLTRWLSELGAEVFGFSRQPPTSPCLYELAEIESDLCGEWTADICDQQRLRDACAQAEPEIVIHLAAQAIVSHGWLSPEETLRVNVAGTAQLLTTLADFRPQVVVCVTSDKCYLPTTNARCTESDPLGGHDPYSASKACQEIIASSYGDGLLKSLDVRVATARSGNVIGGGDWAHDRLVCDYMRSKIDGTVMKIRNPDAIRPWQHVLNPLYGYLLLAESLFKSRDYAGAWNFGPESCDECSVAELCDRIDLLWGDHNDIDRCGSSITPHQETEILRLDSSKAKQQLKWYPRMDLASGLEATVAWYKAFTSGQDLRTLTSKQIESYAAELVID